MSHHGTGKIQGDSLLFLVWSQEVRGSTAHFLPARGLRIDFGLLRSGPTKNGLQLGSRGAALGRDGSGSLPKSVG